MIKKIAFLFLALTLAICPLAQAISTTTCIDTDTKLLWHFNEADASTDIVDSSTTANTETANGNVQTDSGVTKFTNTSLFDGTGDYWTVPDSENWNFGTGDLTIDFWVRFSADPSGTSQYLISQSTDGTNFWLLWVNASDELILKNRLASIDTIDVVKAWNPAGTTWYHVAATRSGTSIKLYIDGTQIGTTTTSAVGFDDWTGTLQIGALATATNFAGNLDELRIIKGTEVAPPVGGPSAQYADSCNLASMGLLGVGK